MEIYNKYYYTKESFLRSFLIKEKDNIVNIDFYKVNMKINKVFHKNFILGHGKKYIFFNHKDKQIRITQLKDDYYYISIYFSWSNCHYTYKVDQLNELIFFLKKYVFI